MSREPILSIITTTDPMAGQLPMLLQALSLLAASQGDCYEVVIVDDLGQWGNGSADIGTEFPSLIITPIPGGQREGQLKAIQKGIAHACAPLIMTVDPDLHPCVPEIPDMLRLLSDEALAVHVVRKCRPGTGWFRRIASRSINFLVRNIMGLRIHDIGSPITLFDRKALDVLSDASPARQVHPRLQAYSRLGDRVICYELKNAAPGDRSHYNIIGLTIIAWKLIGDALHLAKAKRP